jgi:hypothetical protein
MGTAFFAAIDGDWAEDPDELAAALRADWPEMTVRPVRDSEHMAYDLELGHELGSLHADGQCISFKHGEEIVARLAVWWRRRIPAEVDLEVFNDSTAIPVPVPPDVTPAELLERLAAADAG